MLTRRPRMQNHVYCVDCEKKLSGTPKEGKCFRCGREVEEHVSSGLGTERPLTINSNGKRPAEREEDVDMMKFDEDFEVPPYPERPADIPPHPKYTYTPYNEMLWQRYEAFEREQILPWKAHTDAMTSHDRVSLFSRWFNSNIRDVIVMRITGRRIRNMRELMDIDSGIWSFFVDVSMAARNLCDEVRTLSQACVKEDSRRVKLVYSTDRLRSSMTRIFEGYNAALAQHWRGLMKRRELFGGMSLIELIQSEPWFRELCPDGLEDTLPCVSPIHSYIDRIEWPPRFERYLHERQAK